MTRSGAARVVVSAVLVLAAAGCGDRSSGASGASDEPDALPVRTVAGEVVVSCGGEPGWLPSAMAGDFVGETPRSEIEAALDAIAVDPKLSAETSRVLPQGGRTPWLLLADTDDHITIALGEWSSDGPTREAMTMDLGREGGTWTWQGHGSCWNLAPLLRETGRTWVNLTADSVPTDATEVSLGVTELACTGSRDPVPHLHEPVVVSTDESVTVYWTSTPPEGAAECPGNPTVTQTLQLDEPLGDRTLLDGSRWPPAVIGQDG